MVTQGDNATNSQLDSRGCTIGPDNGCMSDNDIVRALFAFQPGDSLRLRIKYAPQAHTANCDGLFYCDPSTNVWAPLNNEEMEQIISPMFDAIEDSLSPADLMHIHSRRGADDMRHIVGRKCADRSFKEKLDANRDILAANNGVWDVPNKTFRPIEPEDFVMTTTGWSYDPLMAQKHRPELEAFIAQVMPVKDEREATLAFYANLMSGHRREKKLLVLTDTAGGSNGKSTFSELFVDFFGKRAVTHTTAVCMAGIDGHKATRLLMAEGLKTHMALNIWRLQSLTSGTGAVEGHARFNWQAGIVLVFNERDRPKFDGADSSFVERLVVPPMRAKFLSPEKLADADAGDFSYLADAEIAKKFPSWRSALGDMLMEHSRNENALDRLDNLPPSFTEKRSELAVKACIPS